MSMWVSYNIESNFLGDVQCIIMNTAVMAAILTIKQLHLRP